MPVDREGATCEAYVAVSRVALSNISSSLSTLAEVRSATFDLPSPELGDSYNSIIRDIYSSPYNLTTTSGSDTYYYGKVQDYTSSQPYVNLILYHVGAKLDLNWNIDEGNRSTLWLQHESDAISVTGLKCKNCYLFKPMQNDAVGADPYTWNISANIGNQWLGREYAYVIPYFNGSSQYPISATVKKVVNSSNGTKTTAMNIEVAGYASYVFTPWLIGKITVDNTTAP